MKTAVVTGASGFLGQELCRHLLAAGYEVRALSRRPPTGFESENNLHWYRCDLPGQIDPKALIGPIDVLIHCAFDTRFSNRKRAEQTNIRGSQVLIEASRKAGVGKFVFISSISAHEGAASLYGQHKLAVEKMLDSSHDLIFRPGFIVGNGGVYQRLRESIRQMPMIPLFYGGKQQIQTAAIEDVCRGILAGIEKGLSGRFFLAENTPVALRSFYCEIAKTVGKKPTFIRLPGWAVYIGIRLLEKLGIQSPLSTDNLLGLKSLEAFDTQQDLAILGLSPRTMMESVQSFE